MALNLTIKHNPVSYFELEALASLKDINVFFDVGARMQMDGSTVPSIIDYLEIFPDAEYHLFEPNEKYFAELVEKTKEHPNVKVNNFGLGDMSGSLPYDETTQSFLPKIGYPLPIKTLDEYCKENSVVLIDFLKIDTEGWDIKVLRGGQDIIRRTHYIQYEVWNNEHEFVGLLGNDFDILDLGFRNYLCTAKRWPR